MKVKLLRLLLVLLFAGAAGGLSSETLPAGPGSVKLDNLFFSNLGSSNQTVRLYPGTYVIDSDLVVPANINLIPEMGAILSLANATLTISGSLTAGLYQIFSCTGTGKVVLGPNSTPALYPQWWGAGAPGTIDDGAAIRAACTAVSNSGIKSVKFHGDFRVYTTGTTYSNLGTFTNIDGLCLISEGGTLAIDPTRVFNSQYGAMFQLNGCHNVLIDGFNVTGPSLTEVQIQKKASVEFVRAAQGCTNINMPYNRLRGVIAGFITWRNVPKGEPDSYRSKNINIGLMEIDHSCYGVSCGWSGDNLTVGMIKSDTVGRTYGAYGCKNHKVNITSKNHQLTDVTLYSWLGQGVENAEITYVNTETTAAGANSYHCEMSWNDTIPGTFRNIKLNFNSVFGTVGRPGLAFMRIKKTIDGSIPDTMDRGHKLENLTISGYIEGIPTTSSLGFTDAGCQWGVAGTPDVWSNINFQNLIIKAAKPGDTTVNMFTGAIADFVSLNNVSSVNTPWAVRKNLGTVNPAGKVIVTGSDIINLDKNYGVYDPIIVLKVAKFAGGGAYTLDPAESGKLIDSEGIGALTTITLPPATVGLKYRFNRQNAFAIRIAPHGASDYINGGGAGKYLSLDSVGASVSLECLINGIWTVKSGFGATSFEP